MYNTSTDSSSGLVFLVLPLQSLTADIVNQGRYSDNCRYEGLPNGRYRYETALPLKPL